MNTGTIVILAGLALLGLGVLILAGERLGLRPGRMPGDIVVKRKNVTFAFPIVSCLVLSVVLSLILWLIRTLKS